MNVIRLNNCVAELFIYFVYFNFSDLFLNLDNFESCTQIMCVELVYCFLFVHFDLACAQFFWLLPKYKFYTVADMYTYYTCYKGGLVLSQTKVTQLNLETQKEPGYLYKEKHQPFGNSRTTTNRAGSKSMHDPQ